MANERHRLDWSEEETLKLIIFGRGLGRRRERERESEQWSSVRVVE